MTFLESDVDYLKRKKQELIDNSPDGGRDLNSECYKRYAMEYNKVKANIPIKFRDISLFNLRAPLPPQTAKKLNNYVLNLKDNISQGVNVYIYGPSGSAKTFLGCYILNKAIELNIQVFYIRLSDAVEFFFSKEKDAFLYKLMRTPCLMIDDIDMIYRSAKEEVSYIDSIFDRIVKYRSHNLLPFIITASKELVKIGGNVIATKLNSILNNGIKLKCEEPPTIMKNE